MAMTGGGVGVVIGQNRKKPGWSVVSEHIQKQDLLKVGQTRARLSKVGQSWAKMGKVGRTEML